ncbi:MAG TPA: hypothetical protein VMT50_02675 [Steroidobacteraceae bacterium]|nr:hypothetical protein [Steroidobacteraceae bacterium]
MTANSKLAARLADWAYYSAPGDPKSLKLTVDVCPARMAETGMSLQASIIYFDHVAVARPVVERRCAGGHGECRPVGVSL